MTPLRLVERIAWMAGRVEGDVRDVGGAVPALRARREIWPVVVIRWVDREGGRFTHRQTHYLSWF